MWFVDQQPTPKVLERRERERERERGGWGEGWDGEFGMGGGRGEQLNKLPNVGPQMF